MTVLTKKEFEKAYAEEYNTTQKDAAVALEQVFNLIEVLLVEDKVGVKLGDLGTLLPEVKPEREHGIPKSTEKVLKLAHYAPKYKANSAFKRKLAEQKIEG